MGENTHMRLIYAITGQSVRVLGCQTAKIASPPPLGGGKGPQRALDGIYCLTNRGTVCYPIRQERVRVASLYNLQGTVTISYRRLWCGFVRFGAEGVARTEGHSSSKRG